MSAEMNHVEINFMGIIEDDYYEDMFERNQFDLFD